MTALDETKSKHVRILSRPSVVEDERYDASTNQSCPPTDSTSSKGPVWEFDGNTSAPFVNNENPLEQGERRLDMVGCLQAASMHAVRMKGQKDTAQAASIAASSTCETHSELPGCVSTNVHDVGDQTAVAERREEASSFHSTCSDGVLRSPEGSNYRSGDCSDHASTSNMGASVAALDETKSKHVRICSSPSVVEDESCDVSVNASGPPQNSTSSKGPVWEFDGNTSAPFVNNENPLEQGERRLDMVTSSQAASAHDVRMHGHEDTAQALCFATSSTCERHSEVSGCVSGDVHDVAGPSTASQQREEASFSTCSDGVLEGTEGCNYRSGDYSDHVSTSNLDANATPPEDAQSKRVRILSRPSVVEDERYDASTNQSCLPTDSTSSQGQVWEFDGNTSAPFVNNENPLEQGERRLDMVGFSQAASAHAVRMHGHEDTAQAASFATSSACERHSEFSGCVSSDVHDVAGPSTASQQREEASFSTCSDGVLRSTEGSNYRSGDYSDNVCTNNLDANATPPEDAQSKRVRILSRPSVVEDERYDASTNQSCLPTDSTSSQGPVWEFDGNTSAPFVNNENPLEQGERRLDMVSSSQAASAHAVRMQGHEDTAQALCFATSSTCERHSEGSGCVSNNVHDVGYQTAVAERREEANPILPTCSDGVLRSTEGSNYRSGDYSDHVCTSNLDANATPPEDAQSKRVRILSRPSVVEDERYDASTNQSCLPTDSTSSQGPVWEFDGNTSAPFVNNENPLEQGERRLDMVSSSQAASAHAVRMKGHEDTAQAASYATSSTCERHSEFSGCVSSDVHDVAGPSTASQQREEASFSTCSDGVLRSTEGCNYRSGDYSDHVSTNNLDANATPPEDAQSKRVRILSRPSVVEDERYDASTNQSCPPTDSTSSQGPVWEFDGNTSAPFVNNENPLAQGERRLDMVSSSEAASAHAIRMHGHEDPAQAASFATSSTCERHSEVSGCVSSDVHDFAGPSTASQQREEASFSTCSDGVLEGTEGCNYRSGDYSDHVSTSNLDANATPPEDAQSKRVRILSRPSVVEDERYDASTNQSCPPTDSTSSQGPVWEFDGNTSAPFVNNENPLAQGERRLDMVSSSQAASTHAVRMKGHEDTAQAASFATSSTCERHSEVPGCVSSDFHDVAGPSTATEQRNASTAGDIGQADFSIPASAAFSRVVPPLELHGFVLYGFLYLDVFCFICTVLFCFLSLFRCFFCLFMLFWVFFWFVPRGVLCFECVFYAKAALDWPALLGFRSRAPFVNFPTPKRLP